MTDYPCKNCKSRIEIGEWVCPSCGAFHDHIPEEEAPTPPVIEFDIPAAVVKGPPPVIIAPPIITKPEPSIAQSAQAAPQTKAQIYSPPPSGKQNQTPPPAAPIINKGKPPIPAKYTTPITPVKLPPRDERCVECNVILKNDEKLTCSKCLSYHKEVAAGSVITSLCIQCATATTHNNLLCAACKDKEDSIKQKKFYQMAAIFSCVFLGVIIWICISVGNNWSEKQQAQKQNVIAQQNIAKQAAEFNKQPTEKEIQEQNFHGMNEEDHQMVQQVNDYYNDGINIKNYINVTFVSSDMLGADNESKRNKIIGLINKMKSDLSQIRNTSSKIHDPNLQTQCNETADSLANEISNIGRDFYY